MRNLVTCEKCGHAFKFLGGGHKGPCDRTPIPKELAKMISKDPMLSMTELSNRYNVSDSFLRRRLKGTRWTGKRLRQRGLKVRVANMRSSKGLGRPYFSLSYISRKCPECSLLLEDRETICKYCLEERQGIKNYRIKYGIQGQP